MTTDSKIDHERAAKDDLGYCYGSRYWWSGGRWQDSHPCPTCGYRYKLTKAHTIPAHKFKGFRRGWIEMGSK